MDMCIYPKRKTKQITVHVRLDYLENDGEGNCFLQFFLYNAELIQLSFYA